MQTKEPEMWDYKTDVLPEDHPLAHNQVMCERCRDLVHAFNNENMCPWVETDQGNYCLRCILSIALPILWRPKE